MGTERIRIDFSDPFRVRTGKIDSARVDATTEEEIAEQIRQDEEEAARDAARHARRIRRRLGVSQTELARLMRVSEKTIRNWEKGRSSPRGPARALMRLLDKAPEIARHYLR